MATAILPEPVSTGNTALNSNAEAPAGPVLKIVNGRPVVSSLDVAEHFGKRHANVVRHIQAIIRNAPESFSRLHFESAEYMDAQGKPRPSYDMTRDGFSVTVMGFTGKKALEWKILYTLRFNAMEAELSRQQTPTLPTTLTTSARLSIQNLIAAKVSHYPSELRPKAFKEAWSRVKNKFQVAKYEEIPEASYPDVVTYILAMEMRTGLPAGEQPKALPAAAQPFATIRDYASIFRGLPDKMDYWRNLSRRLVRAHDAFQGELDAIKKDALRPFRENRRIEVATFLDSATVDGYKRMFEIAEDGQHVAYRGAYGALLGLEGLHDLLVRG